MIENSEEHVPNSLSICPASKEFVFSSMWVETQGVLLVLAFGIYPFLFSKHSTLLHDC